MNALAEHALPTYLTITQGGTEYNTRYYEQENVDHARHWAGYKCIRTGVSVVYATSNHSMETARQMLAAIVSDSEQIYRYASYAS